MNSNELLPVGTKVRVSNEFGEVTRAEMVPAHPCGVVCLHTIRFTHKAPARGGAGRKMARVPLAKVSERGVNYSFITIDKE